MISTNIRRIVSSGRLQGVCNNVVMDGKGGRAAGQQQKNVGASGSGRRKHMSQQSNNKTESKGGNGSSNANRSRRPRGPNKSKNDTNNDKHTVHIIESGNFQSNYHAKLCRAAKYKVHAPLCPCPKVVKLRNQYQQQQRLQKADCDCSSTVSPANKICNDGVGYANEIQFDTDGSIMHQLSRLDITSNNSSNSGKLTNNKNNNNGPFDNLIVLPDTKGSNPSIYVCNDTNLHAFQHNGYQCEKKLAREIFGHYDTTDKVCESSIDNNRKCNSESVPPFKVNCAICLLTTHQRNGFVAIISNSLHEIQVTIQHARSSKLQKIIGNGNNKQQKEREVLHADHAHFVCAIDLSTLQSLVKAGKTRSKSDKLNKDILKQIMNDEYIVDSLHTKMNDDGSVQIKMGHHLTSLLWLLPDTQYSKPSNNNTNKTQFIMVLGYIDNPQSITLDLPGGKRHLGESTMNGVIREVEEECSLLIDENWLMRHVSTRYGGSKDENKDDTSTAVQVLEPKKIKGSVSGDAFFVMSPPPTPCSST